MSIFKIAANAGLPFVTAKGVLFGGSSGACSTLVMQSTTAAEAAGPSMKTSVGSFLLKNEVTKAKIMECMNIIMSLDLFVQRQPLPRRFC